MNARLMLLVIVAGTFMAAWNGDQRAAAEALALREQRIDVLLAERAFQRQSVLAADEGGSGNESGDRSAVVDLPHRTAALIRSSTEQTGEAAPVTDDGATPQFDIPAGVAAGTYHAVNHSGDTRIITVPADGIRSEESRELYTVDTVDGTRWYLIRIQPIRVAAD